MSVLKAIHWISPFFAFVLFSVTLIYFYKVLVSLACILLKLWLVQAAGATGVALTLWPKVNLSEPLSMLLIKSGGDVRVFLHCWHTPYFHSQTIENSWMSALHVQTINEQRGSEQRLALLTHFVVYKDFAFSRKLRSLTKWLIRPTC